VFAKLGFLRGRLVPRYCLPVLAVLLLAPGGRAQSVTAHVHAEDRTIPALLVSDIHFDPFQDPDRAARLAQAPVEQWPAILTPPATAAEQQSFLALQRACGARGVDTNYSLLRDSLAQMRAHAPEAKFMTVSGDLIAHSFACRYKSVFPAETPAAYQAFVVKTIRFVAEQLRAAFPGAPIYIGLGNNDTACGDYRLDPASSFLAETGAIVAAALPPAAREQVRREFATGGYFSLPMAAPMQDTRLIVINDLFWSTKYAGCSGKPDPAAAAAQLAWLRQQLSEARQQHQKVWLMGHIPPGVNPFSTFAHLRDVCGGDGPEMFLSSDALADLIVEYAGTIRLGIFAHSHMDELRLLAADSREAPSPADAVAVKLVPSISPVDGNHPAFTVARVDPASATLEDYAVIAAPSRSGAGAWPIEYDFAQAYHQAAFTPAAAARLIGEFQRDPSASSAASQEYIRNYFAGNLPELKPFWPQYVCALAHHTAKGYAACVCGGYRPPE
jgi:sphingomyelin phosphodiesterase acid-like 3